MNREEFEPTATSISRLRHLWAAGVDRTSAIIAIGIVVTLAWLARTETGSNIILMLLWN